jgi:CheY-like chemotaxis protein
VEKVVTAAERAADLTRQLLAYSGRGQFERRPIQLNTLITENLHLFEVAIHKQIKLKAVLDDALPMIEADAGQMQQVIMNLILNAAEAIGEDRGSVTVTTEVAEVSTGETHIWHHGSNEMPPGEYVVLGVHDDGCGMDEATLARIFDPFFTTKFTGRGLGLAAVLGIVRGHKGGLKVDSRSGEGTSFSIYLPVVAEEDALGPGLQETVEEGDDSCGPILVIDDEAAVRDAVRDILDLQGLKTLMAHDGQSGLTLYAEYAEEIEMVILDLSMPGMGGLQVLQALREMDADVPVLLSSGYAESEIIEDLDGMSQVTFIQKPYSAQSLVKAVQRFHRSNN